ncbi:hypothetical protein JHK82_019055 [Glycine max]|nr:hypothetical protein JHK86_019077 [Glycine max]KAG5143360.1 hypothetical protein JHK82_019055 [Glycine max]
MISCNRSNYNTTILIDDFNWSGFEVAGTSRSGCFFYLLGAWQRSGSRKGDNLALKVNNLMTDCTVLPNLSFESHDSDVEIVKPDVQKPKAFKPCDMKYIDYTPCQEQDQMKFPIKNMIYRERHCPSENEKLHCLIPAHKGYMTPLPWPKSRDYSYYANVPYKILTVEKAVQNWVQFLGNVFKFPGGGTMFPQGADVYIYELVITNVGLLPLLQNCEAGLVNVNLIGCWNLIANIVSALVKIHGGTLELLNLDGCWKITDASSVAIAKNFIVINDLDVSKCAITNAGIAILSRANQPSLQVLSLSGCSDVSNKSAPFLTKLGQTLLGLNLQNCNSIGSDIMELLVEKLWRCHILA